MYIIILPKFKKTLTNLDKPASCVICWYNQMKTQLAGLWGGGQRRRKSAFWPSTQFLNIIIDHVAQPKGEYCIYENIEFRNIRLLYYNRQYKKSLSSMTGPPKTKRGGKRRGKSEFDSVISFLTNNRTCGATER